MPCGAATFSGPTTPGGSGGDDLPRQHHHPLRLIRPGDADEVVVEAAPIARWTVGRNARAVVGWWLRRGATIVVMEERDGARI